LSLLNGAQNGVGSILRDATLVKKLDENNRFYEIELATNADPQALLRRLVDAGAGIERFELVQPSLHQVFIQRVGASGVETGMSGHG
jgi:ABC-2 type transport system ATP-binding protein